MKTTEQICRQRREICRAIVLGAAATGMGLNQFVWAQDDNKSLPEHIEFQRLIAANRILANENVVDAFGHVSVRDPHNPDRYVMSHAVSPALVEYADLMEFEQDGTPINAQGRRGYGERMIHGAVYEARKDVNAVVHHHAYSVVPYGVTSQPLVPLTHTASVIGKHVPVWDIADKFGDTDTLARSMEKGRDLAATLADNTCVLMRGHGAVVVGATVQEAVISAVYLEINARILTQALSFGESPQILSDREVELARKTQFSSLGRDRAWEYFCRRAGIEPI
jgi:HCOMODA/2-hydroxy-3-carboxy-muconic semialdehyde decarboxylase